MTPPVEYDGSPFIPAALDDAELTPEQFRILCRIFRRGNCTESVPRIARACRVNRKTAWAAINILIQCGMVLRLKRHGTTSILVATVPSAWAKPVPFEGPTQKDARVSKRAATQPERGPDHPSRLSAHKGSPLKGSPFKVAHREHGQRVPTIDEVKAEARSLGMPESLMTCVEEWAKEMTAQGWKTRGGKPMNWRDELGSVTRGLPQEASQ